VINDDLGWETDEVNPNQVIYDFENDKVIIPNDDDFDVTPDINHQLETKIKIRNVGNSRNRRIR
jgi:hypothetical protein